MRPEVNRLVGALEQLNIEDARSEVLMLRRQLQEHDPDYFSRYMKYRSQRTTVVQILRSNRVYRRSA